MLSAIIVTVGCTPQTPGSTEARLVGSSVAGPSCDLRFVFTDGRRADLRAFLAPDATESAIGAVRELLDGSTRAVAFEHRDKEASWQEYQTMFAEREDMLAAVDRAAMPSSFLVIAADGEAAALGAELERAPAVREVLFEPERPVDSCTAQ